MVQDRLAAPGTRLASLTQLSDANTGPVSSNLPAASLPDLVQLCLMLIPGKNLLCCLSGRKAHLS